MIRSDSKYSTRTILIGLWVMLVLLYLYCDIFSFFRTGTINEILAGKMGPLEVSQSSLLVAGIMMMFPIFMILVNLILSSKIARWLNTVMGVVFIFVNIGNLIGEGWLYYWLFGITELLITIAISMIAFNWDKEIMKNVKG